MSSCSKKEPINIKPVEIRENHKAETKRSDPQINGYYEIREDTEIYAEPNISTAYDLLKKGDTVKVILEPEDGFVRVDYFGNQGYVKVDKLRDK